MMTIPELLREHVSLDLECVDRVYMNGYIPVLQSSGGLVYFLEQQRGQLIASPVMLGEITQSVAAQVEAYAKQENIPIVHFQKGQRKDDVAAGYRRKFTKEEGVVFIGVAQEKMMGWKARKETQGKMVRFQFSQQSVFVRHYYFYLQDREFGPAFLKIGAYAPYPVKVYVNGHEWAKQQMKQVRLAFAALDHGFLECHQPERLQTICNRLGPEQVQAFFDHWVDRLPWPLNIEDRKAGYYHRLSIWQMEVSRTQVFLRPVRGREFFEQVIRENLDLGRPDRVQLIFGRQVRRNTPSQFRTQVLQNGVQPTLHILYKHSSVKQYFKENRALRTETTTPALAAGASVNNPHDFGVDKGLRNWEYLRQLGTAINRRLLETERFSQDCLLSCESFERVSEPTTTESGQRAPGLRFGQPRVMALFAALSRFAPSLNGFRHAEVREIVASLLGLAPDAYTPSQMSYDLRRLRLKGLIARVAGKHTYILTTYGRKVVYLMTKLQQRIFNVASAALETTSAFLPSQLAHAFRQLNDELDKLVAKAQLAPIKS